MATQPADDSAALTALVDLLAADVVAQYVQAEQDLIAEVAAIVRKGLVAPVGSAARLDMLRRMQDAARRVAVGLHLRAAPLAQQVIDTAIREGAAAGARRIASIVASHPDLLPALTAPQPEPVTSHALAAAIRLRLDLASRLDQAALRITRFGDDAYRAAVARASIAELLSGGSPAAFQRAAWDDLMSQGITGFTDVRGRRWNLASYVEMAARTAVQRAYNEAHLDRMQAAGVQLFTVAPHAHPCPLCQPWEGRPMTALELDGARAAGLFHPNCTHTLVAYFEGVTRFEPKPWTARDQAAYDAAQQLRALERRVRMFRLQEAGALTPLDRKRAAAKARATQAAIRAHTARHPLVRRPRREQINLGHH